MLKLVLFVLPLGLDTFAVAAALGIAGVERRQRLRLSLLMSSFEMAMPVIGLFAGHALGALIGHVADFIAAAALIGLGGYLLLGDEGGEEEEQIRLLSSQRGLALIALGISISLDELAVGFTIGLLRLSIVLAVILIGTQAFVAAQIGFTLGARLGEAAREWAERLAGAALIGLGGWILAERLVA